MANVDCLELLDKTLIMYDDMREFKRMKMDRKLEKFNDLRRSRELYKESCQVKERSREEGLHHLGQFDLAMCKIAASLFYEKEEVKTEWAQEIRDILEYFSQEEIDSALALDRYSNIENMDPHSIANAIFSKEGEIYTVINEWYSTQNDRYTDLVNRNYEDQGNAIVAILTALYTNRFRRISEGVVEYIHTYPNAAGKIFLEYGDVVARIAEADAKSRLIAGEVEKNLGDYSDRDIPSRMNSVSSGISDLEKQIADLRILAGKSKDSGTKMLFEAQLREIISAKNKIELERSKLTERQVLSGMKSGNTSRDNLLKSIKGVTPQDIRSDTIRFNGRFRKNVEFAINSVPEFTVTNHANEIITVKNRKDWSVNSYSFDPAFDPESGITPMGTVLSYSFSNRHFFGSDIEFNLKAVYYAHSLTLSRKEEDLMPMSVDDFIDAFKAVRDKPGASEVIGFASPTGFSEELIAYISPEDGKNSFSQTNVSIILIDLTKSAVIYNRADLTAAHFAPLYGFETPDERVAKVKQCVDELSKSSDTCHILEISECLSSSPKEVLQLLETLQKQGYGKIIRPRGVAPGNVDSVLFSVNAERR